MKIQGCDPLHRNIPQIMWLTLLARVAFWTFLLIHSIFFQPICGDTIDIAPGQSIEGHLFVSVDAPQGHKIEITTSFDQISNWTLDVDKANYVEGIVNVKSNKDGWMVLVKDVDTTTSGHMTEWTGSSYGTLKLAEPLKVRAAQEVSLPEGGLIQTGSKTPKAGQDVNVVLDQDVGYDDEPLSQGHVYRIVITIIGTYAI